MSSITYFLLSSLITDAQNCLFDKEGILSKDILDFRIQELKIAQDQLDELHTGQSRELYEKHNEEIKRLE